jgi:hypothetical protein
MAAARFTDPMEPMTLGNMRATAATLGLLAACENK